MLYGQTIPMITVGIAVALLVGAVAGAVVGAVVVVVELHTPHESGQNSWGVKICSGWPFLKYLYLFSSRWSSQSETLKTLGFEQNSLSTHPAIRYQLVNQFSDTTCLDTSDFIASDSLRVWYSLLPEVLFLLFLVNFNCCIIHQSPVMMNTHVKISPRYA